MSSTRSAESPRRRNIRANILFRFGNAPSYFLADFCIIHARIFQHEPRGHGLRQLRRLLARHEPRIRYRIFWPRPSFHRFRTRRTFHQEISVASFRTTNICQRASIDVSEFDEWRAKRHGGSCGNDERRKTREQKNC